MPSIKKFKLETAILIKDIDDFKATDYYSSLNLLLKLAQIMGTVASLILPQTQGLKIIIGSVKILSAVIKKYVTRKKPNG